MSVMSAQCVQDRRTKDPETVREMVALEDSFANFPKMFFLLDKIGEGTFSCVYKAVDLDHSNYDNSWQASTAGAVPLRTEPGVVAVKRIHVTSSPSRIANELEILATLQNSPHVSHVITAIRDRDQVLVVMPHIEHTDFRSFYRTASFEDIRHYMRELLEGLAFVHSKGVIHRDIKPTNFLYDFSRRRGVLADFGLAEFATEEGQCCCEDGGWGRTHRDVKPQGGYRKDDMRPGRRANRAGTRGFRAPEVLFKCSSQTTQIDIWAAGVILLMFMSRRFPFFNSTDDSEALVEIASICGRAKMQKCALLHGCVFETTIPTIRENGYSFAQLLDWCNHRGRNNGGNAIDSQSSECEEDTMLVELLAQMLEPDFRDRLTAKQALCHRFFSIPDLEG